MTAKKPATISKYITEGFLKMNPDNNPTKAVDDLENEVYWLWRILWDYLSDEEKVAYMSTNSKPFTTIIDDLDPLIDFCTKKYIVSKEKKS